MPLKSEACSNIPASKSHKWATGEDNHREPLPLFLGSLLQDTATRVALCLGLRLNLRTLAKTPKSIEINLQPKMQRGQERQQQDGCLSKG